MVTPSTQDRKRAIEFGAMSALGRLSRLAFEDSLAEAFEEERRSAVSQIADYVRGLNLGYVHGDEWDGSDDWPLASELADKIQRLELKPVPLVSEKLAAAEKPEVPEQERANAMKPCPRCEEPVHPAQITVCGTCGREGCPKCMPPGAAPCEDCMKEER